jgi:hypothetical protein
MSGKLWSIGENIAINSFMNEQSSCRTHWRVRKDGQAEVESMIKHNAPSLVSRWMYEDISGIEDLS